MVTSTPLSSTQEVSPSPRTDAGVKTVARTLRQKREEGQSLVRLVEQAATPNDKGRHVDYYG
jgi:hypothetical protein